MNLKPGTRWRSAIGNAEFVVVRPPKADLALFCAGAPVVPINAAPEGPGSGDAAIMLQTGKRYTDEGSGIELLITKAGPGPLAIDGRELVIKEAKPLPSSD